MLHENMYSRSWLLLAQLVFQGGCHIEFLVLSLCLKPFDCVKAKTYCGEIRFLCESHIFQKKKSQKIIREPPVNLRERNPIDKGLAVNLRERP